MKNKHYKNPMALSVAILLFAGFILLGSYIFKDKTDIRTVRTQASLTTHELFTQLQAKNDVEYSPYIEKAIEVKGVIKEITVRDGVYSIILDGDNRERHILCEMQRDQNNDIVTLAVGEEVVIKGILKGLLLDAILLNCILV
ncbi:hypothetical protein EAX61_04005 [Dokdonia sinensis]|uniref:tRNA_anti-like n=1 Tax=Dokdonia sinensis TaxID=2479847 RepID=A0A3M0GNG5_9FLAO|nr:hypothetical protein [Dokdonia sinensis]RMB62749.1 hypothetical protein EAX61_04005 [Dokdonia sinensis]